MRYAIVVRHPQEHTMPAMNALAVLGLTAVMSLAGCDSLGPKVHDQRVMKVRHVQNAPLDIVTANGSIRAIQESRNDVSIEVDLYGRDAERLSFTTVHADRQGDETLRVWIDWPGGKRLDHEGAKIEVFVPDAEGVAAKTSNGTIVIMGLAGHAKIRTTNGSVQIKDHNGPMDITTTNGPIRVEDSVGDLKFDTSNGRILVSNADGLVEGDTSNGNVYVSTTDDSSGPIRVRTTNGRIELDLGYGYEGILRVGTTNGRISTEGLSGANLIESSNNRLEMQLGHSDEISAVKTTNGSVRIHGRSN